MGDPTGQFGRHVTFFVARRIDVHARCQFVGQKAVQRLGKLRDTRFERFHRIRYIKGAAHLFNKPDRAPLRQVEDVEVQCRLNVGRDDVIQRLDCCPVLRQPKHAAAYQISTGDPGRTCTGLVFQVGDKCRSGAVHQAVGNIGSADFTAQPVALKIVGVFL